MAERITEFSPRRVGRPASYPWPEWTDGSAWRITRGEDFEISVKSMATSIYRRAAREGATVTVRIVGESVQFQFVAEQAA